MTMTAWILAALAIFVVQTMMPASIRFMTQGDTARSLGIALGPRDEVPEMPVMGERAERALNNMHEALPVFLAIALLLVFSGRDAGQATTGAAIFVAARALYVPAYMVGIPGLRSVVWMSSWVGLGAMIHALIG